jgi:uncharacterized membrane protein
MKHYLYFFLALFIGAVYLVSCKHDVPNPVNGNTVTIDSNGCDPNIVYFENDVLPLISSGCAFSNCHDAASHKEGVILIDYASIMDHGDIKPGKPNSSKLYEVLLKPRSSEEAMPPPPNAEFTTAQKDVIKKWIEQGALNNRCDDCDTTSVKYNVQVTSVLNKNCNACHSKTSASGSVILDSYGEVKKYVDNGKLVGAINHKAGYKAMPPSGTKMTDCNLKTIQIWIDNGAQND